ncbi:hypothetical protein M569_08077 [Genlisea aurea]|uniref:Uncharacterized protein n=1 Tax=Genlisea aurea TaxID=192259 RepID=S8CI37_9LAMI|nr:hypothetical protein M569_08077 [Genlisea aurea]
MAFNPTENLEVKVADVESFQLRKDAQHFVIPLQRHLYYSEICRFSSRIFPNEKGEFEP